MSCSLGGREAASGGDDREDFPADLLLGVDGLGTDMRRQHHVGQIGQRRASAFPFGDVDIERGAPDPAARYATADNLRDDLSRQLQRIQ